MVFFMMTHGHRGQKTTNEAIVSIVRQHGNASTRREAVSNLNNVAKTLERPFWIWALGQMRAYCNYQKSQICMWTSFFLKSRGLSWLGMESLADQGIVCGRGPLNRWSKQQAEAMEVFCRQVVHTFLEHSLVFNSSICSVFHHRKQNHLILIANVVANSKLSDQTEFLLLQTH